MPTRADRDLVVWGSEIDESTIAQARRTARLPVVDGHVALMPDAHIGIGATIGSVIPTRGAVIPSAVGVDIGCGMVAVRTDLRVGQLPDDLTRVLDAIEAVVPAGVGQGHREPTSAARAWLAAHPPASALSGQQERKTLEQFGTLGSGNHFFEVCADEAERVWLVLHSGSRGIGNELAMGHIRRAKKLAAHDATPLEDPDLAYFVHGTPPFERYIADMRWAQDYAMANRAAMMDAATQALFAVLGAGTELSRVNCHHNFAELEEHGGKRLWITRKGAIRARAGELGIVPGSMGAPTFIVRGRGEPASYTSCAHGAGRRMSRTHARKTITIEEFESQMQGRTWLRRDARRLIDEAPAAYKDITQVMRDQADLVEVVHELRGLVNYKGL